MGDSRAVLVRKGGSILPLSNDHKPTRPDEKKRIERAGGSVVGGRVMGRLAVSRAFGHKKMKTTGVMSAEAEVISTQLCNTDQFVILACDGLWDVMGAKDAVKVIHSSLKTGADLKVVPCGNLRFLFACVRAIADAFWRQKQIETNESGQFVSVGLVVQTRVQQRR